MLTIDGAAPGRDGEPIGDRPSQPAELLLTLQASLVDDRGTRYARHSGQAGGSGTEQLGRWSWTPVPPAVEAAR